MIPGSLEDYVLCKGVASGFPRTILPFHRRIYEGFHQVLTGTLPNGAKNLGICMPPGHGKTWAVQDFMEYAFGHFPDSKFMYASYGLELAVESTKAVLQNMQSEWYKQIFQYPMFNKKCTLQSDHFKTAYQGALKAVGVGGPATGFRAGQMREGFSGALIYDDLLKAQDTASQTVRNAANTWHYQTASSRVNRSDIPKISICQRLHPEDIVGFLQKNEPELWHWIIIPAVNPDGSMLWADKFSKEMAELLKKVQEFTFFSQYQQAPQLEGGNLIKKEWWKYHDLALGGTPKGMIFATMDTAYKKTKTADYSSLKMWCATATHLDLIDHMYGKWEFPELLMNAKAFHDRWKHHLVKFLAIEDKASGISLEQTLRLQGLPAVAWKPSEYDFPDDKVGRVRESTWYIQAGRVRLPLYLDMEDDIDEHAAFAEDMSHSHDDRVDTTTMAVSIWRSSGGGADVQTV